jgi:cell wall assembly regulator SMI1
MKLQQFADKWGSRHYPPDRVTEGELRTVEEHFGVRLPDDYRQSVLETGLPRPTIALLDAISEGGLDLADASDFHSPADMIRATEDWRTGGLPGHLIVFAIDCGGNMFCFDADRLRSNTPDAASIWFFDHDFGTVECIAPNFDSWIAVFCDVEPWPGTEIG